MIPVTKPFLPPSEAYLKYLDGIWERQCLTNMGPLSSDLEKKLKIHLDVENLLFVSNGTIALQLAIKALDLNGEIITTPFTYVATTSSIVWEGCIPVYVDIDKNIYYLDGEGVANIRTAGLVNPNLTWVNLTLYNAGLDFRLFKGKFYTLSRKRILKTLFILLHYK